MFLGHYFISWSPLRGWLGFCDTRELEDLSFIDISSILIDLNCSRVLVFCYTPPYLSGGWCSYCLIPILLYVWFIFLSSYWTYSSMSVSMNWSDIDSESEQSSSVVLNLRVYSIFRVFTRSVSPFRIFSYCSFFKLSNCAGCFKSSRWSSIRSLGDDLRLMWWLSSEASKSTISLGKGFSRQLNSSSSSDFSSIRWCCSCLISVFLK